MTDQEINEAIAFHLGWTKETKEIEHQDGYQWTEVVTHWRTPGGTRFSSCEDYCNDLNAMHEAEECLCGQFIDDCEAIDVYQSNLSMILGGKFWKYCHAYARDRARAFLMTIGKWRDA